MPTAMAPFLEHERSCKICRARWDIPCARGAVLLKDGALRLTQQLVRNPRRARA